MHPRGAVTEESPAGRQTRITAAEILGAAPMYDLLLILDVMVSANGLIGRVLKRYPEAARRSDAVATCKKADEAAKKHKEGVRSEVNVLSKRIIRAVTEYREAVEPSRILESWNPDAPGCDDPAYIKEEAARLTAEHRRDVEPNQTTRRIFEISRYRPNHQIEPSYALEMLFDSVNRTAKSCADEIRSHFGRMVSFMDQILIIHLEEAEILPHGESCAEHYGIYPSTPPWPEGLDGRVDSGGALERRLAEIIDACGARLDHVMAPTRAPESGDAGRNDVRDWEFYRYPKLHKRLSKWCGRNTGPDGEKGHAWIKRALEKYNQNLNSALRRYREDMDEARDVIRNDFLNKNVESEIDDIVKFEACNPNAYGLARWVEEHTDFKVGGAAARLVAETDKALAAFRAGTNPDGALAWTAEIDREADALVKRMAMPPDMMRFATNAYEMVCERIANLKEPSALSWTMLDVAEAVATDTYLEDHHRRQLSDTVANAVADYFTPTRLPVSLDYLFTEDADLPETLRPLIKDVRAMAAKVPKAKKSRDTMRITRKVARAVAEHSSIQNS